MSVVIKRSTSYNSSKKINFVKKGPGGSIKILGNPPIVEAIEYLSASSFRDDIFFGGWTPQVSIKNCLTTGSAGSTWLAGAYFGVLPNGYPSGKSEIIWQVKSDNAAKSITPVLSTNSGDPNDPNRSSNVEAVEIVGGWSDNSGNYWTAGWIGERYIGQVTASIVKVDAVTSVATAYHVDDAIFRAADMKPSNFVVCGNAYVSGENAVWHFNPGTGIFSGTTLNLSTHYSLYPFSVKFDEVNNSIYSTNYAQDNVDYLLTGTLWRVNRTSGAVSRLFLTGTKELAQTYSAEEMPLTIDSGGNVWVVAQDQPTYPASPVPIVWKVTSMSTYPSSTYLPLLDSGYGEIIGIRAGSNGNIWVVANTYGNITVWRLYGNPVQVSGTLITSGDPTNYSYVATSFSLFGETIPVISGKVSQPILLGGFPQNTAYLPSAMWCYVDPDSGDVGVENLPSPVTLPAISNSHVFSTADDVFADTDSNSLRFAGTLGYATEQTGRVGRYLVYNPSLDSREVMWKVDSNTFNVTQNVDLRPRSGTLPF